MMKHLATDISLSVTHCYVFQYQGMLQMMSKIVELSDKV